MKKIIYLLPLLISSYAYSMQQAKEQAVEQRAAVTLQGVKDAIDKGTLTTDIVRAASKLSETDRAALEAHVNEIKTALFNRLNTIVTTPGEATKQNKFGAAALELLAYRATLTEPEKQERERLRKQFLIKR